MLVSLCSRESLAEYGSEQTTQRIPFTLLALMEMPTPVQQKTIPFSHSPHATAIGLALFASTK